MNEFLEHLLEDVYDKMPKEPYRDIDNTPKNLIHMTDEDMQTKSPAVLRYELDELIKEAKSKIKPVMMSESNKKKYIGSMEDFEKL